MHHEEKDRESKKSSCNCLRCKYVETERSLNWNCWPSRERDSVLYFRLITIFVLYFVSPRVIEINSETFNQNSVHTKLIRILYISYILYISHFEIFLQHFLKNALPVETIQTRHAKEFDYQNVNFLYFATAIAPSSWKFLLIINYNYPFHTSFVRRELPDCHGTTSFRDLFCSRVEFDVSVDRRTGWISGERRINQGDRRRRGCCRGHPLHARRVIHDTPGPAARKFNHQFHQGHRRNWRPSRSGRGSSHVSSE